MKTYQWREGFPEPSVEAQVFGEAVEAIAASKGEEPLAPADVVELARPEASPLHAMFQWDDKRAGELYRQTQARHFLGALQVVRVQVEDGPTMSSRAFHIARPKDHRGYVSESRILSDRDLRMQVLAAAKKDLEGYLTKYMSVLAMGPFIPRLQDTTADIQREIAKLEAESIKRDPKPKALAKAKAELEAAQ